MLEIKDLHVKTEDNQILKGINLSIKPGEIHAIMGPNGSGKSTLAKAIAGHPSYEITQGEINYTYKGNIEKLTELEVHERAQRGIFIGMQYPVEIPGVTNLGFLHESYNEVARFQKKKLWNKEDFIVFAKEKLNTLNMNPDFLNRAVNVGFSGGEKKKNEILQMAVLEPYLAFLDETDSGLDIDALKVVANGVNKLSNNNNAIVLVTHYQRLLDYIKPDFVHVLYDGKIIKSGGNELAQELEEKGYEWIIQQ